MRCSLRVSSTLTMSSSPPSIAIVGAGPAGLTLARILLVKLQQLPTLQHPRISIFEKDANHHAQTDQIDTVDLHTDTGLAAMKAAELVEEIRKHTRSDREELVIADKNGTELVHLHPGKSTTSGAASSRVTIDRAALVEILLHSIGRGRIHWGKKLIKVMEDKTLHFTDGSVHGPFDLIVGADGAVSRAREALTDVEPTYSGFCGFEGLVIDPDAQCPAISHLLGRGAYYAFSDDKCFVAKRLGNNDIKLSLWIKAEEDFHARVMKEADGQEYALKQILYGLYPDWQPMFKNCISAAQNFQSRALYELPVGDSWQHKSGITLIGDAAHLTRPFSGKDVNAAMRDALGLADAIVASLDGTSSLDKRVEKFERGMATRSREMQEIHRMYRKGMLVGFMVDMMDIVARAKGRDLDKGLLSWVPARKAARLVASTVVTVGAWTRIRA